jgi:Amt family ammonium transporter
MTTLSNLDTQSVAAPPIEMRLLTDQCLGNLQFALTLLAEFEKTARERMTAIEEYAAQGNLAKVAQVAHALAGVAAILASSQLSETAVALQSAAEQDDAAQTQDLIAQLRAATDRVLDYIPQFKALAIQVCGQ